MKSAFPILAFILLTCPVVAQSQVTVPSANAQAMLIKNTLTALNHANISGNYTVLRDLASDRFKNQHKAADLSHTFRNLRSQNIDLSPVLVTQPQLSQLPILTPNGRLRLMGTCPTTPLAVQFDLYFQHVGAGWMIDEIGLSLAGEPATQQPAVQPVPRLTPPVQQAIQPVQHIQPQPVHPAYQATGLPSHWQKSSQAAHYPPPTVQRLPR